LRNGIDGHLRTGSHITAGKKSLGRCFSGNRIGLDAPVPKYLDSSQFIEEGCIHSLPYSNNDCIGFMVDRGFFIETGVEPALFIKNRCTPLKFYAPDRACGCINTQWSPRWVDYHPFFKGLVYFPFVSGHLVPLFQTDHVNFPGTEPSGSEGNINGNITPSDDEDLLSHFSR